MGPCFHHNAFVMVSSIRYYGGNTSPRFSACGFIRSPAYSTVSYNKYNYLNIKTGFFQKIVEINSFPTSLLYGGQIMKSVFPLIIFLLATNGLFAENIAGETLSKRIDFYTSASFNEVAERISSYRNDIRNIGINEEDRLSVENILLLEEMNFTAEGDEEKKKNLYLACNEQALKCGSFIKDKRPQSLGTIFLVSYANIKVRLLGYLPSSQMYRESHGGP
jgi:hypothetical protein